MSRASEWAANKTGPRPQCLSRSGKLIAFVSDTGDLATRTVMTDHDWAPTLARWILDTFEG